MLSETREALKLSGVERPYILYSHSMSGIEAIYWAEKYPQEIHGIIGLDMAVPEAYENFKPNMLLMELSFFANRIGITWLLPNISDSDVMKYGTLTEDAKRTAYHVWKHVPKEGKQEDH